MVEVVFPPIPEETATEEVTLAAEAGILPAHTSMAVLQDIIGMVVNVWQAAMKAQAGQILLPDPNPGVNLPQTAVALTLIGIMAAVIAEAQALILEVAVPHPAINVKV